MSCRYAKQSVGQFPVYAEDLPKVSRTHDPGEHVITKIYPNFPISERWRCCALKNKSKKKAKDEKCGSELTTPENSSSPGMMDIHDDNSNQSSIADGSPVKQENSSNSSPAPEQNCCSTQADGPELGRSEVPTNTSEQPDSEDTSGQNSQSSIASSMNSSEKTEVQPCGDKDLTTESSKNSQDSEGGVPPSKKIKVDASQQNDEEI
uniref:B-cell CLL/lymphoma 7 protein family member A n=1 Tax=Geotrypetes seraphini TaxID=260995 RepID=A0A6P8S8I7_GEOSA|nr:B-cell CLL/lymphoma 7 protein family member A isoform X2 [Geotrypetes seraphini]XP_033813228.1 B-cell CLL/lymphoma 7 protein family member A isoform X2 [Geotrypetes seraphini]